MLRYSVIMCDSYFWMILLCVLLFICVLYPFKVDVTCNCDDCCARACMDASVYANLHLTSALILVDYKCLGILENSRHYISPSKSYVRREHQSVILYYHIGKQVCVYKRNCMYIYGVMKPTVIYFIHLCIETPWNL